MKAKHAIPVVFAAVLGGGLLAAHPSRTPRRVRRFIFTYQAVVNDLPADAAKVRIWIPLAASDANQTVMVKNVSGPVRLHATRESVYGNRMMFAEIPHPRFKSARFTIEYQVTRREFSRGDYASLMKFNRAQAAAPASVKRFLLPDRLVPVTGLIRNLADENTEGYEGPVDRAHALYNYVFHTLRYDKSGTGWGRGDALWACDAKHGNCTDFHSLFIALARSVNIPAQFEIGFPLPENRSRGDIAGYHCWAKFYVAGVGWIPVDISEAWQNPSRRDYYFGSLDANRIGFARGRDLRLAPAQAGPPLNYFVYPYVEVDGKPFGKVEHTFLFRDLNRTSNSGSAR